MTGPAVAVTGATGFVGRAVMARLAAAECDLRPLNRADGPDLATAAPDVWARAVEGAEVCVHLAAMLPWSGENRRVAALPRFLAANAEGPARLFRGFAAAGGRHFVFLSTIGVNGTTTRGSPFRPDDPPRPAGNYAVSKARAEAALCGLSGETGVALTILRPPIIYGAGVRGPFAALVDAIARGRALPLGGIDSHRDMMGLRNLADLIAAVIAVRPEGIFLVRDRDPVSTTGLAETIAAALGREPRLWCVPRPLRALARALPGVAGIAERLFGDVRIDDSDIGRACRWTPRYSVAEEIRQLADRIGQPPAGGTAA